MRMVLLTIWWFISLASVTAADVETSPSVQPEPLSPRIESVLKQVSPSVVSLWYGETPQSHVTGTIISPEGLIVTCEHMRPNVGETVEVRLDDGRRCEGKVLSKLARDKDDRRDLALVQLVGDGPWRAVEVGTAIGLTEHDPLISVGFGNTGLYVKVGDEPPRQIHLGYRLTNIRAPDEILATAIHGSGGDSGGPLFDLGGRLVGTLSSNGAYGAHNLYITADLLREEWKELAGDRPAPPLATDKRPVTVSIAEETASAVRGLRDSVVEVRSDDRWAGVGVVVGRGLILTKASELGPNLTVVLRNDIPGLARLAATDSDRDLALLRMPASDLTDTIKPIEWSEVDDLPAGTPVACVTPADFNPPVGVVCVPARPIPALLGGLAVVVKDAEGGVAVEEIVDGLNRMWLRPMAHDLHIGDIITHVGGEPVPDRNAYLARFRGALGGPPRLISGDMVRVTLRREDRVHEISTRLRPGYTVSHQLIWPYSYRYTGFPRALACDFTARPEHCGAPVVDAGGRAVGLLIARAPFVESLVIPASEVKESLRQLIGQASTRRAP